MTRWATRQRAADRGGELAAPVPVIAEASPLILDRLGTAAQSAFLRLVTSDQLVPVDLTGGDRRRCDDLAEQYARLRLDLIDASVIAVAERLNLTTLATLKRLTSPWSGPGTRSRSPLLPD
jgi:hypothetical protein